MVSYRVYSDESGKNKEQAHLFLAGSMMSIDEWAEIELPWREKLKEHNLDLFHAKDVWAKHPKRLEVFQQLGELIYKRNLAFWWGAVNKADFQTVKKDFPKIKENDFEFLLFGLIGGCHRSMDFLGEIGRIGVIVEKGHPAVRQFARERIDKFERKQGIFDHPWQTSPKGPVPLQVADYIAWHYNRLVETQNDKWPFFEFISPNNKMRFWGQNFDEKLLRKTFKMLNDLPNN
ncbi:MAG: DUF3800 domain-containing protein [Candidatus Zixiibacteriota bacterium]